MRSEGNIRIYIQLSIFVLTLAVGFQFLLFVNQASQGVPVSISRPPGVEGFLPIGALMAWKALLMAGYWDPIHPAGMVILGFAALVSFLLRKSFCGWFCPVGTISEWVWKAGERLWGKNYRLPQWVDIPLRSIKYILLGFFLWVILTMKTSDILHFLNGPYYKMADVKMLFFFTRISSITGIVLMILTLSSFFFRNPWCRYLCPYGALMGLFALLSPTGVERNSDTCIDCKRCSRACPYDLPVHRKKRIRSAECNGCMRCVLVCPVDDTLKLKTKGLRRHVWSQVSLGLLLVIFFVSLVYAARITGHWKSSLSEEEFKIRLLHIDSPAYRHPSVR